MAEKEERKKEMQEEKERRKIECERRRQQKAKEAAERAAKKVAIKEAKKKGTCTMPSKTAVECGVVVPCMSFPDFPDMSFYIQEADDIAGRVCYVVWCRDLGV